ncbi:substrate-binding domain-containing protein [Paraburkholderia sp. USG1]|uniref:substrate-binding domain-containing protein n=1 Tax=Paraburkholderia sp. USG1 TaxID=2952268 RepID=UPI00285D40E1|nr:substrate-binding domain-containing protein [Paraburkholderia sp. USG1]MDR8398303.1 substrate-binding domain-containing protein [Paraburkholderia sp. USG1]
MLKKIHLRRATVATFALLCLSTLAKADGLTGAPAPFDKGGVRIAVVNCVDGGDWLQAFEAGTRRQARALKVDLRISEARQDPNVQRQLIEQAITLKVDGIVINNGKPEALRDVAQRALDAGIKVVAYDVNLDNPKIPQIEPNDRDMARLVLEQAVKEQGDGFKAGAIYVAGFAPLDHRYAEWKDFGKQHGIVEKAVWGVVNDSVPASVADQTKAALRSHPDITAIFAPWDEFARGATLAVNELGLQSKVKVYGVDISTSDIQAIVEPHSPWVATAATNAAVVGEVSVRAVSLLIAGQNPGQWVLVKPALVTRAQLVDNRLGSIEQLAQKITSFRASDAASASWIPSAQQ